MLRHVVVAAVRCDSDLKMAYDPVTCHCTGRIGVTELAKGYVERMTTYLGETTDWASSSLNAVDPQ